MNDEDRPRPAPALPPEAMSIEDLEAHIAALHAEIALCERVAAQKRSHRAAADSLFKGASS